MTGEDETAARVWARVLSMYRAAERGDSARVDEHIREDATLWDTDEATLIRGLTELHEVRGRRPDPGEDAFFEIEARDPVVDVLGGVALIRHVFRVRKPGGAQWTFVRNTSVWERQDGEWFLRHNHEDVQGDADRIGPWRTDAAASTPSA